MQNVCVYPALLYIYHCKTIMDKHELSITDSRYITKVKKQKNKKVRFQLSFTFSTVSRVHLNVSRVHPRPPHADPLPPLKNGHHPPPSPFMLVSV